MIDWNELVKMPTFSIEKLLRQKQKVAKGRLTRLKKGGNSDIPLFNYYNDGITKFDFNKLGVYKRQKMISQLIRVEQFLSAKTSTNKGAKKYKENVLKNLNDTTITSEDTKLFWDIYNKIVHGDQYTGIVSSKFMSSNQIRDIIGEVIQNTKSNNKTYMYKKALSKVDDYYEDLMDKYNKLN